jgi:hypothetical protein
VKYRHGGLPSEIRIDKGIVAIKLKRNTRLAITGFTEMLNQILFLSKDVGHIGTEQSFHLNLAPMGSDFLGDFITCHDAFLSIDLRQSSEIRLLQINRRHTARARPNFAFNATISTNPYDFPFATQRILVGLARNDLDLILHVMPPFFHSDRHHLKDMPAPGSVMSSLLKS